MATLYIIPTPIGNIKDITLRALDVLKAVPVILCEDTRVTRQLMDLLKIDISDKKLVQFHDHNEFERVRDVISALEDNIDVGLVSDAGMPLISDPGFKLVREIRSKANSDIKIEVLPGASSITTALATSGLPTDKFFFLGYFPRKTGGRTKLFESIKRLDSENKTTYVALESPHRLVKSLEEMKEVLGQAVSVSICRELTKLHEQVEVGSVHEILDRIAANSIPLKGEFVVIFHLGD